MNCLHETGDKWTQATENFEKKTSSLFIKWIAFNQCFPPQRSLDINKLLGTVVFGQVNSSPPAFQAVAGDHRALLGGLGPPTNPSL